MYKKNELIKKTVIITGYSCNNRCKFCLNHNKRGLADRSTSEVIRDMQEASRRGRTYLEIIGGEQTIRPDLIELVKYARRMGFRHIVMATNARMFSYIEYAKRLADAGLTGVILSIHGHNAVLHDSLTQVPGSFKQLLKGLNNLKKEGLVSIGSNTAIVKQNYRFLPLIGKLIYDNGIRNAEFIFVDPTYGGAHDDFKKLVPRISEASVYIKKCLDIGKKFGVSHWRARYVPLCYFSGYLDQISELYEADHFQTEIIASDFRNSDALRARRSISRFKPDKCCICRHYSFCEGIWKVYADHYGYSELIAVN